MSYTLFTQCSCDDLVVSWGSTFGSLASGLSGGMLMCHHKFAHRGTLIGLLAGLISSSIHGSFVKLEISSKVPSPSVPPSQLPGVHPTYVLPHPVYSADFAVFPKSFRSQTSEPCLAMNLSHSLVYI